MKHKISLAKYPFIFFVYLWLRFDLILRLTFKNNWTPRYQFLASIFGEQDAEQFLKHRVKLVKARNKKQAPLIHPQQVHQQSLLFLKANPNSKTALAQRQAIIKRLSFWALNKDINQQNIDSYKTRSAIVSTLLGDIFQNSLISETRLIIDTIKKIVFSRITYLGSSGEPSPIVHDVIISGVSRILTAHFSEVSRLRDTKVDQLTKMKLIKEINKAQKKTGSLAFSAQPRQDDNFRPKYPLAEKDVKLLLQILVHYQFSAWPDSREKATATIENLKTDLGFQLDQDFYIKCN